MCCWLCWGGSNENEDAFEGPLTKSLIHSKKKGQRLGTANNDSNYDTAAPGKSPMERDVIPEPVYDSSLTDDERAKTRADRAAAAEARLKKAGGPPKQKKKTDAPLTGPNTKPLMRWTS